MLYFCIALQIYMWDDFYYGCSSFSEAGDFFNRCGLYQRKPIGTWVINNNIYICLSNTGWSILDEASTSHYNCIFHTWHPTGLSYLMHFQHYFMDFLNHFWSCDLNGPCWARLTRPTSNSETHCLIVEYDEEESPSIGMFFVFKCFV